MRSAREVNERRWSARSRATSSTGGEGLDHIIVGAGIEPGDTVVEPGHRRQSDDGHVEVQGTQARDQAEPVAVGQPAVEHDRVVTSPGGP